MRDFNSLITFFCPGEHCGLKVWDRNVQGKYFLSQRTLWVESLGPECTMGSIFCPGEHCGLKVCDRNVQGKYFLSRRTLWVESLGPECTGEVFFVPENIVG